MPRRRTGRRRGRPRLHRARWRETTRAGRRGEFAPDDRGTVELRAHRIRATTVEDLPVDPLGVLVGRQLITKHQYLAGRDVEELIATVEADFGGRNVASAWARIFAGPVAGGSRLEFSGQAERALRVLDRLRHRIRSKQMVYLVFLTAEGRWLPALIAVVADRELSVDDQRELDMLGLGLERVARCWSSGRDLQKTA